MDAQLKLQAGNHFLSRCRCQSILSVRLYVGSKMGDFHVDERIHDRSSNHCELYMWLHQAPQRNSLIQRMARFPLALQKIVNFITQSTQTTALVSTTSPSQAALSVGQITTTVCHIYSVCQRPPRCICSVSDDIRDPARRPDIPAEIS
jgi:hypothetical protein